ncbi:hypothetical protein LCGC14_1937620, partial [marine sediment metagenome]
VAFVGFAAFMKKAVAVADIQEKAEIKLANALKSLGQNTKETRKDLLDFASSLQSVTTFGDEAIIEIQALLTSLGGLSGETLKRATAATLDFAAAMDQDAKAAAINFAKAATGFTSGITRYIGEVKLSGDVTEDFTRVLTKAESKLGGTATVLTKTFGGALQQLWNSLGDVTERMGFSVTKSERFIAVINELRIGVDEFVTFLDQNIDSLVKFGDAAADAFVKVAESLGPLANANLKLLKIVSQIDKFLGDAGTGVFAGIGPAIDIAIDATDKLGERIQAAVDKIRNLGKDGKTAADQLGEGLDTALTEAEQHVLDLQGAVESLGLITQEGLVDRVKELILGWEAVNLQLIATGENTKFIELNMVQITELADELRAQGAILPSQFEAVNSTLGKINKNFDFAGNLAAQFGATLTRAALQGELTFKRFFKQLLVDLAAAIVQAAILAAILSSFGGKGFGAVFKGFFGIGGSKGGIVPGFAGGGIVPGVDTGRDTVLAGLRPGELILPPEVTRAIVDAVNRPTSTATFNFQGATGLEDLFEDINALVERRGFTLRATETVP